MAQVIPDSKNFFETQQAFLKQSLQDYSSFLGALPLLVKYYSKDHLNSTHDENLHTVQEILGDDSPVKFNVIFDFPFYKATNLDSGVEDSEDVGSEGDVNGTALVPPQMVTPRIDDLFVIPYFGKETIFRVNQVKRSNIRGRSFFEVTYYLYSVLGANGDLSKQVQKEYQVVGSPTSVSKSAIIAADKAQLCQTIQKKIELLINNLSSFYEPIAEAYVFKGSSEIWRWDECVHSFISNNQIFDRGGNNIWRNEITLRHVNALDDPDMYTQYQGSVYWALENSDYNMLDESFKGAFESNTYASESPARFLQNTIVKGTRYTAESSVATFNFQRIFGNIKEYLEDESGLVVPDVGSALKYIRLIKSFKEDTVLTEVESHLEGIIPERSIYDYYYLPTAIFIFKGIVSRIRTLYNFNN